MPRRSRVGPTPEKAAKMLKHGTVHGKKITHKQKKFFRAVEHGFKPTGKGMSK